jgi:3-oxoadipate enol-lactonase
VTLAIDELGDGHPVVLLHAGIADRRMWDGQLPALAAAGHRALAVDLPGFGESPVPTEGFSFHDLILSSLAERGVHRATYVGCSFGGRVALDLTLAHPEAVDGLVLFGSALSGEPTPDDLRRALETATAGLDEDDLDAVAIAEVLFCVVGVDRTRDDVPAEVLDVAVRMNRIALGNEAELDAADVRPLTPPATGRLAEIAVPTVVTTGMHDVPAFRRLADRLATEIPGARRLPDIPGAAHLPPLDQPEAVNQILRDFLTTHP